MLQRIAKRLHCRPQDGSQIAGGERARAGRVPPSRVVAGWLGGVAAALVLFATPALAVPAAQTAGLRVAQAETAPKRGPLDWPSAWRPVDEAAAGAVGAGADAPATGSSTTGGPSDAPGIGPGAQSTDAVGPGGTGAESTAGSADAAQPATSGNPPAVPQGELLPKTTPAPATPEGAAPPAVAGTIDADAANGSDLGPGQPAPDADNTTVEKASPAAGVVKINKDALPDDLQEALRPVSAIEAKLDGLSKTLERVKDRQEELAKLQPQIETVINEAVQAGTALRPRLDELKNQVTKLGPTPNGEAPRPESSEIAKERDRLNKLVAAVDGAIKKSDLIEVRGRQLVGRLQSLRQAIFTRDVLARTRSPLHPSSLSSAAESLPGAALQISAISQNWAAKAEQQPYWVGGVLLASLITYFLVRLVRRRLFTSRLTNRTHPPDLYEKTIVAGLYGPLATLPTLAALAVLYFGLDYLSLLYLQIGKFAWILGVAVVVWKVSGSLARAYLQPRRPNWRIAEVSDDSAQRIFWILQTIAVVFAIDMVVREVIAILFLPLSVQIFATFLVSLAFAGLFYALARTPLAKTTDLSSGLLNGLRPEFFKIPLILVAIVVAIAALTGYVALARYIAGQIILTGAAVQLIVIMFVSIRAIGQQPEHVRSAALGTNMADDPSGAMSLSPEHNRLLAQAVVVLLYSGLVVLAPVLILLSVGFTWIEISSVVDRALFGFEIGGVRISLVNVAIALAIFVGIIFVTRTVQRGLSETVLHPTRTDQGLSNSIKTGLGYIGFAVAALASVSYVGLDITNLAIVAGALSVGIGFGLQSIVNNFVSGLILLVERPIKVGDWIKVGTHQGYVRRISVRSTEIETFDRASVIVPNSELISGSVTNLTHRNALGRVQINVGVSYDADPEQVQALLLEVANSCDLVAKHPAPFVVFEDFGDSALSFSVRAYLTDINKGLSAQTALRTMIFASLREANIEIPYPQRDLHLRDLDGVKGMLARAAEQKMREAAMAGSGLGPADSEPARTAARREDEPVGHKMKGAAE